MVIDGIQRSAGTGEVFRQGRRGRKAEDADGRSYEEFAPAGQCGVMRIMRVKWPPYLNSNCLVSPDAKSGSRSFAAGICGQIPAG